MGKFSDLKKAMYNLQEKLRYWCKPDGDDNFPVPEKDEIKEIMRQYEECCWLALQFIEDEDKKDPERNEKNFEYAKNVMKLLTKDIKAFKFADEGMTVPQIMSASRVKTVNISSKQIGRVGNSLSSRKVLKITNNQGKKVKGYFTDRVYVNLEKSLDYMSDKYLNKYLKKKVDYSKEINIVKEYYRNHFSSYSFWAEGYIKDIKSMIKDKHLTMNDEVESIVEGFTNYMDKVRSNVGHYESFSDGLEDGRTPVDTRNTALYNMSMLLGISDIVPKTYTMKLQNGDEMFEGTFMEHVEGEDIDLGSKIGYEHTTSKTLNTSSLDYSPALKQLADIEIMDYICGNNDRHPGNLICTFSEDGKKILGVKAIDNDMSFTPFMNIDSNASKHSGGLDGICCISSSMKDKLDHFDMNMVERALDGLDFQKEAFSGIEARFKALKERVDKGLIPIIHDDEFKDKTLSYFMDSLKKPGINNNIFLQVGKRLRTIQERMEWIAKGEVKPNDPPAKKQKTELEEFDLVDSIDNTTISQDVDGLREVLYDLGNAADNSFENFDDAMYAVDSIKTMCIMLSQEDELITEKQIEKVQDVYRKAIATFHDIVKGSESLTLDENTKDGMAYKSLLDAEEFCKNKLEFYDHMLGRESDLDRERREAEEERRLAEEEVEKPRISREDAFDVMKGLVNYYNDNMKKNPTKDYSAFYKKAANQIKEFFSSGTLKKEDLEESEIKEGVKNILAASEKLEKTAQKAVQNVGTVKKGKLVELPSALSTL